MIKMTMSMDLAKVKLSNMLGWLASIEKVKQEENWEQKLASFNDLHWILSESRRISSYFSVNPDSCLDTMFSQSGLITDMLNTEERTRMKRYIEFFIEIEIKSRV